MSGAADLLPFFDERFKEVETYLEFLEELEKAAQSGPPRLEGSPLAISAPQQRILYSSVYLQLYNLVEATVSRCIEAVCDATQSNGRWRPDDLNSSLKQEWVRAIARTHIDMSPDNRLKSAMAMCDHLMDSLPISDFSISIGGGGNWDDDSIEKIGVRVGCSLRFNMTTRVAVKRPLRNEMGALKLVKSHRNSLAHGSISFVECADGVVVDELRTTVNAVGAYLHEVIESFSKYIESFDFLRPDRKPQGVA
ncbi:MAE_28990/MAE_18760 family HEPN-like nuclease [Dactylosporangium sp. CA-233914]|uniref:MAE_28990/MAE_18760 family HEPN-like nuclease n=1 Tax=Dactylosporangium sp. CA-233914 TaxID=3239934 RepID=UPI003D8A5CFE